MHLNPYSVFVLGITHSKHFLFKGLPAEFEVMRYHSLILKQVEKTELKITAQTKEKEVMALAHPEFKIAGVQFHPESILTPDGLEIMKNWFAGIKAA